MMSTPKPLHDTSADRSTKVRTAGCRRPSTYMLDPTYT